ncbi:MAG TPA: TonB-dependent receptor [Gemmatimonadaceae bacterium]|nr:TonB-dependent receptor [Gemmatimonadaceae bacterium]
MVGLLASAPVGAQDTTARKITHQLAPVVTIARDVRRSPLEIPYAISTVQPDSARPGQPHTRLVGALFGIPDVFTADRGRPAQDPRIVIRGFGDRSQFGVRSVRILRDGISLTDPDGQTAVDYLDRELVGQVETIRGAAASLYGNASGGVIDFHTAPPPTDPLVAQGRAFFGSYDLQRYVGLAGGTVGPATYDGDVVYTHLNGYRAYSEQRLTSTFARATAAVAGTALAFDIMGLDEPVADDPGALTLKELQANPRSADPLSVTKEARKSVTQLKLGLTATHALLDSGVVTATLYGGPRSLYNPLTYAIVDLEHTVVGGSVRATIPVRFGVPQRVSAGVDLAAQNDSRENWDNCNGVTTADSAGAGCPVLGQEQGKLILNQRELVTSVGPYVRDELALGSRTRVSAGLRADYITFKVTDHVGANSGSTTVHALSPMVGIVERLAATHSVYANVSSAFETPTAAELTTQPSGSGGINPDLKPQYSWTYEVGFKGVFPTVVPVLYDLAGFDTEVQDELISYVIPNSNGRTFYRNAGRTRRIGIEADARTVIGPVSLAAAYTFARDHYENFVESGLQYAGNTIPGLPVNEIEASATYRWRVAFVTAETRAQTKVFVNDANSIASGGWAIVNLRAGGIAVFGRPWLSPVFGVDNVLDHTYVGSVAINAAAGKYYEPSPGRTWFAGLQVATGPL